MDTAAPKREIQRTQNLPAPLRLFLLTSGALTLLTAVSCAVARWRQWGPPYSSPFLPVHTTFGDLLMFTHSMPVLGTPAFFHTGPRFAYPAGALLIYKLFYLLPHRSISFLLCALVVTLSLTISFARALRTRGLRTSLAYSFAFAMTLLSYPFWFGIQRGNIEFFVLLIVAAGAFYFLRRSYGWAGFFWGIATAIKLFPIFLVALLLTRARWRGLAIAVLSFSGMTLWGLRLISRDLAYAAHEIVEGLVRFKNDYTESIRTSEINYDHSAFSIFKRVLVALHHDVAGALPVFLGLAAALCIIVWFAQLRRLPLLNQLIFAVAAMVTLMPTSMEYTLQHVYVILVPLALICTAESGSGTRHACALMVCLAVLTAPLTWMHVHGVSFMSFAQCLALLVVMALALRSPWQFTAANLTDTTSD